MSVTVYGPQGSGAITAYTAPNGQGVTVETLSFTVAAGGTAGVHRVRVTFYDENFNGIAVLDDLNASGPGQTTTYTYGLFLNASACTTATGWAVTDALPGTQLRASCSVEVMAINDNGAKISGDSISGVVLQVSGSGNAGFVDAQPLLVPTAV